MKTSAERQTTATAPATDLKKNDSTVTFCRGWVTIAQYSEQYMCCFPAYVYWVNCLNTFLCLQKHIMLVSAAERSFYCFLLSWLLYNDAEGAAFFSVPHPVYCSRLCCVYVSVCLLTYSIGLAVLSVLGLGCAGIHSERGRSEWFSCTGNKSYQWLDWSCVFIFSEVPGWISEMIFNWSTVQLYNSTFSFQSKAQLQTSSMIPAVKYFTHSEGINGLHLTSHITSEVGQLQGGIWRKSKCL